MDDREAAKGLEAAQTEISQLKLQIAQAATEESRNRVAAITQMKQDFNSSFQQLKIDLQKESRAHSEGITSLKARTEAVENNLKSKSGPIRSLADIVPPTPLDLIREPKGLTSERTP